MLGRMQMNNPKEKVIIFPKWKEDLEKQSLQAMQEKRFSDALEKLEQLLSHDINTHEILTGKIICLMELGRHEEAEEMCKELINLHNEHYHEYIHIYLTLLFQMSKYGELLEQLDMIFSQGNIPEPIKEQFSQLYEISKKLNQDKEEEEAAFHIDELEAALEAKNSILQWRAIAKAKSLPAEPHLGLLRDLLVDKEIHPVVKTEIVQWLQNQSINEDIAIEKLGKIVIFNPSTLTEIQGHHITNQISIRLKEIEQKNPSLYELIEKLLARYLYVRYPVMPENDQLEAVSNALKWLSRAYLSMGSDNIPFGSIDEETKFFIKEIQVCEKEYFSVLLD